MQGDNLITTETKENIDYYVPLLPKASKMLELFNYLVPYVIRGKDKEKH